MRPRPRHARLATAVAVAIGVLVASSSAPGATSSSVLSATVPSATTMDATGCATGQAGITDFGLVLPGASVVTPLDCVVEFGSSNDTSMLRLYQTDGGGDAMIPAPATGTLAMWTFNGSMRDESTTGNDGDPFPAAPNDPSYVAGGPGRDQALSLDGDDYATIPDNAAYYVNDFTVDAWIRTTDPGTAVIAAREDSACGFGGMCQWELYLDGTGKLVFEIEVGSTWKGPTTPSAVNDGNWHHVAMTVDNSTKEVKGYVDGVHVVTDTNWSSGTNDSGAAPIIIGRSGSNNDWYTGDIDELRHQPGILTENDIRRYFEGRVTDYANATLDWDTDAATTNMFGVCLDSVGTGALTDGSTFVPNPGCPVADGTGWRAVAATSADAAAKVAFAPSGDIDATANLRFGFRPRTGQSPGAYEAPITFEVLAPYA